VLTCQDVSGCSSPRTCRTEEEAKQKLPSMLGTVLGWVLLLLLLLYCEAAVVIAYRTAVEMDSRIHRQMELRIATWMEGPMVPPVTKKTGWHPHPTRLVYAPAFLSSIASLIANDAAL